MKNIKTSESYLEWEEYSKLISEIEELEFITSTAIESFQNLISKEVEE